MNSDPDRPSLKDRLRRGERLLGVLLRMPSEELAEMAAVSGFDFVLIDAEHGPADVIALRHHLALISDHGVETWVRVGSDEPALVLRALDHGATGIVAPHVDTAAQARALVDSVHYPPLGSRGFATYGRAGRFGLVDPAEHRRRQLEHTVIIGMIESPHGVANTAEIASIPGIDGVMIGTADLAAARTDDDPALADLVTTVHDRLRESPARRMDIVADRAAAARSFEDGADLVVYNLTATLMDHLATLRAPFVP